ncbi:MAG TPA: carboxypeptidase-like regulatory domain-containing protein [Planctomycetaceae bacterium]|nr:carboxypeptidase-like regulatory domain-containing protein [Planctomycetaceae bacterium]
MSYRSLAAVSLLVIAASFGCGSGVKPEVVPPLEVVSGKILLDGKPSPGINVTFFPMGKGNPSTGTTDAEGAYTLTYRNGAPGVPAGDYVVLLSKLTQKDGTPIPEGKTAADVMAVDQIPERFRAMDNMRQQVNVPKGGKTFDFEIKSK